MAIASNPCEASFLSRLWSGNAIVCSDTFKKYEATQAASQIQEVADNAAKYYGEHSNTADVAQTAATQQEAQVTGDVANVTTAVASSTAGQVFTTCPGGDNGLALPGLPCIAWKWLAVGVGGLLVLYVLALVSSVIPRPR